MDRALLFWMMQTDFAPYLEMSVDELLARLALVAASMADYHELLAEAKGTELERKSDGWHRSTEETIRGRERSSQFEAVPATQAKLESIGKLDALTEEKQFLTFLIDIRSRERVKA